MTKIALLFTNYGPYHLARLSGFHHRCQQLGWQVTGVELARSEADYAWRASVENLPYSFVSVIPDQELETVNPRQLIRKLYTVLNQVNPDVIAIAGYARPSMLAALMWCRWHRKSAVLLSATKEDDASRQWLQEQFKQWLLKGYKAALVGGKPQKRYLTKLGMPPERIAVGYNVVGNEVFHPSKIGSLPNPIQKPFFLAVNRFVPKKNLLNLISAYAAYVSQAGTSAWDLVLCGDGELRSQIEQQINEFGLNDCVHLPGFLQQEQLLPYFAHAGCFIHTSIQEQWGLVINEAMAAGLPVLVSNRCGCFEDLVVEGVNGWGFEPQNVSQITELMLKISADKLNTEAMGEAALAHIQKFSPDYFAEGLSQAVKTAICAL